MGRWLVGLVVSGGSLFAAACFNPTFTDPACGPHGECPSGLSCIAGVCRVPGDGSTSDAMLGDGDLEGDGGSGAGLKQKTITISNVVTGSHIDFPVWIALTDSDLAARARMDGADIHFVTATGADLDYELQSWNKSTGRLEAWVRVPSLGAGTQIAIRYGEVTEAHVQDRPGTFQAYTTVWHLDDSLTTTTVVDAREQNNGTAVSLSPGRSVTAQLGRGIDFQGGSEQINIAAPFSSAGPHTISVWINQRATTTNDMIIAFGNGVPNEARFFLSRFTAATIAVSFYANDYTANYDIIGDGWVLLHWVYEGGNRTSRLYRDGTLVAGPFVHGAGVNTIGTTGTIGNASAAFGANLGLNATLDELRTVTLARSATWIAAEFSNQNSPSTFYTLGPEQAL